MIIKIINYVNNNIDNDYDDVDISWNSSWLVAATPNCNAIITIDNDNDNAMQCNQCNHHNDKNTFEVEMSWNSSWCHIPTNCYAMQCILIVIFIIKTMMVLMMMTKMQLKMTMMTLTSGESPAGG